MAAGDVVFVLRATAHESFERSDSDLLTHVKITLSEALLGFSRIILTHLDGRGIKFSSTPGKIVKAGDTIVLRGEGMPIHKRPDEKGNLYVVFDIEMPTSDWLKSVDAKVSACRCDYHDSENCLRRWKHYSHPGELTSIHNPKWWMNQNLRKATLSKCVHALFRLARTSLTRAFHRSSVRTMTIGKTMKTRMTWMANQNAALNECTAGYPALVFVVPIAFLPSLRISLSY